jgi:hypothetical protein
MASVGPLRLKKALSCVYGNKPLSANLDVGKLAGLDQVVHCPARHIIIVAEFADAQGAAATVTASTSLTRLL